MHCPHADRTFWSSKPPQVFADIWSHSSANIFERSRRILENYLSSRNFHSANPTPLPRWTPRVLVPFRHAAGADDQHSTFHLPARDGAEPENGFHL